MTDGTTRPIAPQPRSYKPYRSAGGRTVAGRCDCHSVVPLQSTSDDDDDDDDNDDDMMTVEVDSL